MNVPLGARVADSPATIGLGDSIHSRRQRFAAVAICLALIGLALVTSRFTTVPGPEIKPFLPIVATVWALADLMTAFLLLAQFYVSGTTFLTALAGAYAFSGLMTWPYLLAFPGLFGSGVQTLGDQQISLYIWVVWHAAFPTIVALSVLCDRELGLRVLSRAATRNAVWTTIFVTLGMAVAATAIIFTERNALPLMVSHGRFSTAFHHFAAPGIAALDIVGCGLLLRRGTRLTTLQLWLIVAMFTSMLDGFLLANSPNRYSFGWYVGKLETVITASTVLAILLCEVTGLYRRLAEMATIDTLTRLPNRRALEDHMRLVVGRANRESSGLGLIVVDVDHFKGYNDSLGHAQGDECLRRVAAALKSAATRPLDLAARFGGEEFVVVVPDTPRDGAVAVARRILATIEGAAIPYAASARGHVTVSAGVAYVARARDVDAGSLFDAADRAMYEAKARGRNTFVVEDFTVVPPKVVPLHRTRSAAS